MAGIELPSSPSVAPDDPESHPENNRPPQPEDKYKFMAAFEKKLTVVSWLGLGSAGLHNLTRFLGFCALTWASMVLLGGLISSLEKRDYYLVSSLLLLEASRLAAALFFSNLVTRRLLILSPNPFKRHSHDWQRKSLLNFLRIMAAAGQLLLVSPSILFPLLALGSVHYAKGTSPFNSVDASLYIFYYLVVINACIAATAVLYSLLVSLSLLYWSEDESLQRYYDEVVWRGADKGLLLANDFDFLVFALKVQAEEYSRRVPSQLVADKYPDLTRYLLNEPRGIEVACLSLESDDSCQQQAAANIVGFWAKTKEKEKVPFQTQLLSKLADKLNLGQTGWAAANSFKLLGELDPESVFKVENQKGKKVVNILIDEINPENSWSLVCVRAMLPLVKMLRSRIEDEKISEFNDKLRKIMCSHKRRARDRTTAAFALHGQNMLTEEDKRLLRGMTVGEGEYMLKEEEGYLIEMLGEVPPGCQGIKVKAAYDENKTMPPSHICRCFSVAVVMLRLIVATILFLRFEAVPYWVGE